MVTQVKRAKKQTAAVAIGPQLFRTAGLKPMLYLKSCPRCHGDLHQDSDSYGSYVRCVQCGFNCDLPEGTAAPAFLQNAPCWRQMVLAKAS